MKEQMINKRMARIDDIIYPKEKTSLKAVITALVDAAAHLKE